MRSGKSKIAVDKIMEKALKDHYLKTGKHHTSSSKPTRFFINSKFESRCYQCSAIVHVGEKAMFRPAYKNLPKLFLCMQCAQPWLNDAIITTQPTKPPEEEQHQIDVENRVYLDTSGERDEIYKLLDEIYESQ